MRFSESSTQNGITMPANPYIPKDPKKPKGLKRSAIKRGKPMKRTGMKRGKKAVKKVSSKVTLIRRLDKRARALMHRFFDWTCQCCGEYDQRTTNHHGIKRSQSWYHHYTPMNWHWICPRCHTKAGVQETLYWSEMNRRRPDLIQWILDTRYLREGCDNTKAVLAQIDQWMTLAEQCETYEDLLAMPIWQELEL